MGESEQLWDNVHLYRANREPCIVCGHPTGDCTDNIPSKPVEILGIMKSSTMFDEHKILVEKDVIEERQITPFTTAKVIIANKGSYISIKRAKELGII